jgi:hypothetical protein
MAPFKRLISSGGLLLAVVCTCLVWELLRNMLRFEWMTFWALEEWKVFRNMLLLQRLPLSKIMIRDQQSCMATIFISTLVYQVLVAVEML